MPLEGEEILLLVRWCNGRGALPDRASAPPSSAANRRIVLANQRFTLASDLAHWPVSDRTGDWFNDRIRIMTSGDGAHIRPDKGITAELIRRVVVGIQALAWQGLLSAQDAAALIERVHRLAGSQTATRKRRSNS